MPDLGRVDQIVLWILAPDRRRFQDMARMQPSVAQRVEVAEAVDLEPATHAGFRVRPLPCRQYDD